MENVPGAKAPAVGGVVIVLKPGPISGASATASARASASVGKCNDNGNSKRKGKCQYRGLSAAAHGEAVSLRSR
jgi:hypothetical protein